MCRTIIARVLFIFCLLLPQTVYSESVLSLKILTINIWSGVDYKGVWRFGEYESRERREQRFSVLIEQIQQLDPDIIFIQEENFLNRYVERLADTLSFDHINQVINAGIKFGTIGPPVNFKEGMAILARPSLRLDKLDAWKLSGSPGIYSSHLTIHFDETVFALVGKIFIDSVPVYLVNVHLHAAPPNHPKIVQKLDELREEGIIDGNKFDRLMTRWRKGTNRRHREMNRLLANLGRLPANVPVIAAGDFNAIPESSDMELFKVRGNYIDTYEHGIRNREFTWDPLNNPNVEYSTLSMLYSFYDVHVDELLTTVGDLLQRRIDYIFLNNRFEARDVRFSAVVIDSSIGEVYASDHFGMFAEIDVSDISASGGNTNRIDNVTIRPKLEFLPILIYDTDIGFGYGGKAFFLNHLGRKESFDAIAFNSTKGERWYRFVFSIPDREVRQRKVYPLAFDLIVDYEKQIHNSFFGIGNASLYEDREFYTRREYDIRTIFSRGISDKIVAHTGVMNTSLRNYNFEEISRLAESSSSLNSGTVRYLSVVTGLRYDSRDSFVNPSRGFVVSGEVEYAPDISINNIELLRTSTWLQYYHVLFYPKTVLAFRVGQKSVFGDELPVQVLSSLGGANTLRGYPSNRFLDRVVIISNCELRFPLYRRLGGVAGIDAGNVAENIGSVFDTGLKSNPVAGLRYYMDTFVIRVDAGFGKETMGVYFNFGHVF